MRSDSRLLNAQRNSYKQIKNKNACISPLSSNQTNFGTSTKFFYYNTFFSDNLPATLFNFLSPVLLSMQDKKHSNGRDNKLQRPNQTPQRVFVGGTSH